MKSSQFKGDGNVCLEDLVNRWVGRKWQGDSAQAGDVVDQAGISAEDLLNVVGDYDALIVRGRTKVTSAVFDAGKKLKVVGRAGVGVDNIDLAAAKSHGVTAVNSPLATTVAVAELTLSLMLSLVREIRARMPP